MADRPEHEHIWRKVKTTMLLSSFSSGLPFWDKLKSTLSSLNLLVPSARKQLSVVF
jgi:hypothetical protein